jgi:Raf kinase inhibitor-like YbhB/YbcL family protein
MKLTSTAFENHELIPEKFSANSENASPPLQWKDTPQGTSNFAVIVEDPDAPMGDFTHWLLYNLPGSTTSLPANAARAGELPQGAEEGLNSLHRVGWFGPKPPFGERHRYKFRLFALKEETHLPAGLNKDELLEAIGPLTIAETELVGLYGGKWGRSAA